MVVVDFTTLSLTINTKKTYSFVEINLCENIDIKSRLLSCYLILTNINNKFPSFLQCKRFRANGTSRVFGRICANFVIH